MKKIVKIVFLFCIFLILFYDLLTFILMIYLHLFFYLVY